VLSKPVIMEPAKAKRDKVFFLVNAWPERKIKNEIQVTPGYPYTDGEPVTATVGS
jgi:hypothetical protein